MQKMELVGAVRPGLRWPHGKRTIMVTMQSAEERLDHGRVSVALFDPAAEAAGPVVVDRPYDSLSGMVRALQWCEHTFAFDDEAVLDAWDRELGGECAVCLGAVAAGESDQASRCPHCPQLYHPSCVHSLAGCPVCRRSWP